MSGDVLVLFARVLIVAAVCLGIVTIYRGIDRTSPVVSRILRLGLLLRTIAGTVLFMVSYFDFPVLTAFHTGDGFWNLAPDARAYYELALRGPAAITADTPSPLFICVLSVWLQLVGAGPLSPLLLNLVFYTFTGLLLATAFGPPSDRKAPFPLVLAAACLAFSPVLVLVATQALKDTFFTMLQVATTAGVWHTVRMSRNDSRTTHVAWAIVGVTALFGAVAGVRPYYAFICWLGVAAAALVSVIHEHSKRLVASLALLAATWVGSAAGAAATYPVYANLIGRMTGVRIPYVTLFEEAPRMALEPSEATAMLSESRAGYIHSGGGTNLAHGIATTSLAGVAADTARGVAYMFVPMSALLAAGFVEFTGGRGILFVTDIDSLFIDVSVIGVIVMLWRRRRYARSSLPQLCFSTTVLFVSALLMAYVVTNYGTLFRLRLLILVPLWLVPMALVPPVTGAARSDRARESEPAGGAELLPESAL